MLIRTTKSYFTTGILILILASCGPKNKPGMQGPPPTGVVTQKLTAMHAPYYDEYPATVIALNQVDLRPQVNGYITGIHFKEGEVVKKGQKLYSIDQQQYEGAYQQSVANVAALEANLAKAKKDVERYRELDKHDAVAKQQVDNAEANYEVARRQVEAAKASVRSVQTSVRYTTITAPFDGTIGISQVKLGTAVSAGQTILNTISSNNPVAVDIFIDQKQIFRFTSLQQQPITSKDSTFRISFNGELYSEPGKISVIDRAVNAQTGTILVRLIFPNTKNLLRAGMTGTLKVLNNASQKSIVVPYKAITEQLGEFFVYVVADSNKVTQQHVVLGKPIHNDIIVKEGLKEGETIVVEGVQNLHEGSIIAANTASPEEKKK
jgi:membrane fusion protein, multidrug efflux system